MPDSKAIQTMFGTIAARYDLANGVLSLGTHLYWRRQLMRLVRDCLSESQHAKALDLCTGTGALLPSLSLLFESVAALDFCAPMVKLARKKNLPKVLLSQADAQLLPFKSGVFDAVTIAYGLRNIENLHLALLEIRRVLGRQGWLFILEFGTRGRSFSAGLVKLYSYTMLPLLGGILTGNSSAYKYLVSSSDNFPGGENLRTLFAEHDFELKQHRLLLGTTHLYALQRLD
jgi:demethylmenaquinone methyltransferase / 2-methoxy-6-polyprenyl-1,4-benzoquinol methylase